MLLLASLVAVPALAGGGRNPFQEPDESEFFELDAKLVTVASRYAQSVRKAPNLVTVIDEHTIRERGYRTVSDALRDQPGIYVWKGPEGRHLVAFRGVVSADNNKVLLLVDGVPLYDGVYTHAWIDDYLPIHNVAQIEIIKGPGSAVYGTNAFAGVISIVTHQGEELKGARVRTVAGSRGRIDVSVSAGGTEEVGAVDVEVSGWARMVSVDGDGLDLTPEGRRDVRGEDPRRGVSLGAIVEVEGLRAQITHFDYRHAYLTQEQDDLFDMLGGDIDDFGLQYHATSFDVRYDFFPVPQVELTPFIWGQLHDNPGSYAYWDVTRNESGDIESWNSTLVETEKDTRQEGAGVDVEARPHPDHVTVGGIGIDRTVVRHLVDTAYTDFDTEGQPSDFSAEPGAQLVNFHAHAAHTWTLGAPVEVTLGGRVDKRIPANSGDDPGAKAFATLISPRVGVLLHPSPMLNAKILYGRAFRHGNVRETLVTNDPDADGNYPFANGSLDLRPEQIDTVDAEVQVFPTEDVTVRAAGSFSILTNEIDKVSPPNAYVNLEGGLDVASAELEALASLHPIDLRATYAFTWARYRDAGPYAGRRQFEFPPHMLKGNVTAVANDHFSATLTGELYSSRPREAWAPTSGLGDGPAYGLLHLGLRAARLGPDGRVEVTAAVRNLADTVYSTAVYRDEIDRVRGDEPRYPRQIEAEGRSVQVGVEVKL